MPPDIPQPTDDPADDGEWVSRAEACTRLGISDRTLDYRIARGKLRSAKQGGRTRVWVARTTEADRVEKGLYLVTQFNAQLAAQVQPLVDKVETLARENGALREQLRQAEERHAQLAATAAAPLADPPWWAFWRRRSRP